MVVTCCLLALLLVAYFSLNTRGSFTLHERTDISNYNMLAEAILAGQLHLKQEVHPGRVSAADPVDPRLPYPYIFDSIIFKGRYYFLQEPLPGLIHASWIALTGHPLPTGVMVVLAGFGTLLCLGLILWRVRQTCFPDAPVSLFWFCWMSFAFSGSQLYIISRPVVYHESIAVGVFFAVCGATILINAVLQSRTSWAPFTLSGLFFGAAVASRIPLILYPICCSAGLLIYNFACKQPTKKIGADSILVLFPVAGFILALLLYNFSRFGDFLDFGRSHVVFPSFEMYRYCILGDGFFRLKHVLSNLYSWLFSLPQLKWHLGIPVIVFPVFITKAGDVLLYRERVASIFLMVPVLILALPSPLLFYTRAKDYKLMFLILVCAGCSLAMFTFFLPFVTAIGRYLYEFTPLLFVPVFCAIAMIWQRLAAHHRARVAFETALGTLFVVNCLAGIALGVNGMVQP